MKVIARADFLLSYDGITSQRIAYGNVFEVADHMAKGLIFEGYVKEYVEPKPEDAGKETKSDGRKRRG